MFLQQNDLSLAVDAIEKDKIIGLPTETVYGLAVSPYSSSAVEKLFALKGRDKTKPMSLLVDSYATFCNLDIISDYGEVLSLYWPGPLTVIVETNDEFAHGVGTKDPASIGVRVPDHKTALSLLKETGPLAVTSANRSGEKESKSHTEAESIFNKNIPLYIEGDSILKEASTVVDLRISGGKILRQGSLLWPPSYC
jgi:tRNA threonylcarbamoyl adenosine modification protein (Sua5/YciO/YrdC/YwlC family)